MPFLWLQRSVEPGGEHAAVVHTGYTEARNKGKEDLTREAGLGQRH